MDLKKLREPFHPDELDWKPGSVAKNGQRATLLTYLTNRAVQDRLDEVCGPDKWRNEFKEGPGGGILCGIGILCGQSELGPATWVTKWDGAENTQIEAIKGGLSGAMKRAAAQWGIGRYLYHLDSKWHNIEQGWANGRGIDISKRGDGHIGWIPTPTLPRWALPGGKGSPTAGWRDAQQKAERAPQRTDWWKQHAKFVCANLADVGIKYEDLAQWCEELGKGRPSTWDSSRVEDMVSALVDSDNPARKRFDAWMAANK